MRFDEMKRYLTDDKQLEQAEEYIAASSRRRDELSRMARTLNITGRPLSGPETKFLTSWLDMGFDEELIELACEKTVANTGGVKLGYMNGILKSWHEKGIHTPADVRDKDSRSTGVKTVGKMETRDLGKLIKALDDI
jgi:DnaD/phage-associated family protein